MPPARLKPPRAGEPLRLAPSDLSDLSAARAAFFREELLKHAKCLELQREYYSERAVSDLQRAIRRLLSEVSRLVADEEGRRLASHLLRTIDGATRLSRGSERRKTH